MLAATRENVPANRLEIAGLVKKHVVRDPHDFVADLD